jgi:hypothetical protein
MPYSRISLTKKETEKGRLKLYSWIYFPGTYTLQGDTELSTPLWGVNL